MGAAYNAGANLRDNASKLNIGDIVSNAFHNALTGTVNAISPLALPIAHVAGDFASGLVNGKTPAAPQTTTKAQVKPTAIGGKVVELPGVGKVQMPSEAWLHAHPAEDAIKPSGTNDTKAAASSASPSSDRMASTLGFAMAHGLSLAQLSALSDASYKANAGPVAKAPSMSDQIMGHLFELQQQGLKQTLADPKLDDAAKKSAVTKYIQDVGSLVKVDPMKMALAQQMQAAQDEAQ